MKKQIILCAGLCAAMAFTSCKSGDSAYKQAYMKAKQQEEQQQQQQQPAQEEPVVVAPVETKPANDTQVVDNTDNVNVLSCLFLHSRRCQRTWYGVVTYIASSTSPRTTMLRSTILWSLLVRR